MSIVNPVYPQAVIVEVEINGTWTDLSGYQTGDISGGDGIGSNKISDLVAEVGQITFALNNETGIFSPDGPSAMAGWRKGLKARVSVQYQDIIHPVFFGFVDDIDLDSGLLGGRKAKVKVVTWMKYAANYTIKNAEILTNQKHHMGVSSIVGRMAKQPEDIEATQGTQLFLTIFDNVNEETKAISELTKLALSEGAPIYMLKDGVLRVEARTDRSGNIPYKVLSVEKSNSGYLLKQDGGYLLQQDGSRIILNEVTEGTFDNSMTRTETKYGDEITNQVIVNVYPRRTDVSLKVLYSLDSPIKVTAGKVLIFRGQFKDPDGGGTPINGTNIQDPVITTDYTIFENKDGTGTNHSASATVFIVKYSDAVDIYVILSGADGWVTKMNIRGYGIYFYNAVKLIVEDATSIEEYGLVSEILDQKYQQNLDLGSSMARSYIEEHKSEKTDVKKVHFIANTNAELMSAFLTSDVGSLVRIKSNTNDHGIDMQGFIQKREFVISPKGKPINFSWTLKRHRSIGHGYTAAAVEFEGLPTEQALDYGQVPFISDLPIRTYSAWINLDNLPPSVSRFICATWSNSSGHGMSITSTGQVQLAIKYAGPGGATAVWQSAAGVVSAGSWFHVVAMRNDNSHLNNPQFFVNGVGTSLTTVTPAPAPPAYVSDEISTEFMIGAFRDPTGGYDRTPDGKVKDVKVYNRLLSQEEVLLLYNNVNDPLIVPNGLVFQGPVVRDEDYADYLNVALTTSQPTFEHMYGVVGTPQGSPIIRAV